MKVKVRAVCVRKRIYENKSNENSSVSERLSLIFFISNVSRVRRLVVENCKETIREIVRLHQGHGRRA